MSPRAIRLGVVVALAALAGCGDDDGASTTDGGGGGPRDGGGSGMDARVAPRDGGGGATDGGGGGGTDSGTVTGGHDCSSPGADWLYCEDFERGAGDWDTFLAGSQFLDSPGTDDRGRVTLVSDMVHTGSWAVHMPAAASSGYQGASLDWYACDGASRTNCPLRAFDRLYFRVWVRFAPDHETVHHFLHIGGSHVDDFWSHGTAGCLPNGSLEMGTTVDYRAGSHESMFYTYYPEMSCDTRCERYADVASICDGCAMRGLPTCDAQPQCCWGAEMAPDPPVVYPLDHWFCLEMMMEANTPGAHDGVQEYWIDGVGGHRVENMMWRTDPSLVLNRVRLQHYIETEDAAGHSNRAWFDDMVVSTSRIGCD